MKAEYLPEDPALGTDFKDPEAEQAEPAAPRRRGRQPGSTVTPKSPPPTADPSVVQRALCGLFRGAAKITQSDASFKDSDFDTLSRELCDLAKKAPPLAVALTALQPVIIVTEAIDKVVRIRQGMPRRNPEKVAPDEGVRPYQPGFNAGNN